jgi:hypothetical protein
VRAALWLLAVQGVIGAFDTVYYHEWRARLPARAALAASELKIHAIRDYLYAVIFGSLPWIAWHGLWTIVLALVFLTEIVLTMADFVTEARVRKPLGDVFPGERVTHAVMAIIYGAMLSTIAPVLWTWMQQPTALRIAPADVPWLLRWVLTVMAIGVGLSGVRDACAACGVRGAAWPWAEPS